MSGLARSHSGTPLPGIGTRREKSALNSQFLAVLPFAVRREPVTHITEPSLFQPGQMEEVSQYWIEGELSRSHIHVPYLRSLKMTRYDRRWSLRQYRSHGLYPARSQSASRP